MTLHDYIIRETNAIALRSSARLLKSVNILKNTYVEASSGSRKMIWEGNVMEEYEPSWRHGVQGSISRICSCILASSLQIITGRSNQYLNS